jgi:chromosome segregation ATPase
MKIYFFTNYELMKIRASYEHLNDLQRRWESDRAALECELFALKEQKTESDNRIQKAEDELKTANEKVSHLENIVQTTLYKNCYVRPLPTWPSR